MAYHLPWAPFLGKVTVWTLEAGKQCWLYHSVGHHTPSLGLPTEEPRLGTHSTVTSHKPHMWLLSRKLWNQNKLLIINIMGWRKSLSVSVDMQLVNYQLHYVYAWSVLVCLGTRYACHVLVWMTLCICIDVGTYAYICVYVYIRTCIYVYIRVYTCIIRM